MEIGEIEVKIGSLEYVCFFHVHHIALSTIPVIGSLKIETVARFTIPQFGSLKLKICSLSHRFTISVGIKDAPRV